VTHLLVLLIFASSLGAAVRNDAPTIDAALSFSIPSNPQISPSGDRVLYQLSRTDWKRNSFESDLWMVDTATPHALHAIATGSAWNGDARWSPDGAQIAFVSDRSGQRQVFVVPAAGGEPRKVTSANAGVSLFRWAPDGKSIAFTTEEERDPHAQFKVVKADDSRLRLLRVSLAGTSPVEEIFDGTKYAVHGFDWSPDGGRIAFQDDGIFVLDLATQNVTPVASGAGPYRNPLWSPDGNSVAFETANGAKGFYYSNWFVATAPAGGGPAQIITKNFDENADLYAWTPAGVFFGALQRTAAHLFLANPDTHAIQRVTNPVDSLNLQFSVTPDGSRSVFVRSTSQDMGEVFLSDGSQLTNYAAQLADCQFATRELVEWTSTDGTKIEGVLYKPADFDPSKKYPLLVAIHGGPVAVDQPFLRPDRNYPLEQFVARGALVLRPNYRGSAGYGAKLRALAVRNLGTGDAADIISGVDSLVARGIVDSDRVGAMGWSEGGYIAAFLGTSTRRFKAVSVGAGISDWLTYYVNTDITPFARQYLQSTPWQDPEMYRKASPISYVNNADTPVLIQHGDEDRRVPIANAYELRQALEDRNVPVRMIVYNGFGHTIDRPKQQRSAMEHNLQWFTEWVLDPKVPAPVASSRPAETRDSGDSSSQ
jgi:dipeptidyl aminopeptidase/acylaminoacyl peptidase